MDEGSLAYSFYGNISVGGPPSSAALSCMRLRFRQHEGKEGLLLAIEG